MVVINGIHRAAGLIPRAVKEGVFIRLQLLDVHGRVLCHYNISRCIFMVVCSSAVTDLKGEDVRRRIEIVAADVVVQRMIDGEGTGVVVIDNPAIVSCRSGIVRIPLVDKIVVVHGLQVEFGLVGRCDEHVQVRDIVHVVRGRRDADVTGVLDFGIGLDHGFGIPGHYIVLTGYLQHGLEVVAAQDGDIQFDVIPCVGVHLQAGAGDLVVELLLAGFRALGVQIGPRDHQFDERFAFIAVVPGLGIGIEGGAGVPVI